MGAKTIDAAALRVLAAAVPPAKPLVLAATGWLDEELRARLDALYSEYGAVFDTQLRAVTALLGEPVSTGAQAWCPEALRAACWDLEGRTLALTLVHHDQETPIIVQLEALTREELEQRLE